MPGEIDLDSLDLRNPVDRKLANIPSICSRTDAFYAWLSLRYDAETVAEFSRRITNIKIGVDMFARDASQKKPTSENSRIDHGQVYTSGRKRKRESREGMLQKHETGWLSQVIAQDVVEVDRKARTGDMVKKLNRGPTMRIERMTPEDLAMYTGMDLPRQEIPSDTPALHDRNTEMLYFAKKTEETKTRLLNPLTLTKFIDSEEKDSEVQIAIKKVNHVFHLLDVQDEVLGKTRSPQQRDICNMVIRNCAPTIIGESWSRVAPAIMRNFNWSHQTRFMALNLARRNGKTEITSRLIVAIALASGFETSFGLFGPYHKHGIAISTRIIQIMSKMGDYHGGHAYTRRKEEVAYYIKDGGGDLMRFCPVAGDETISPPSTANKEPPFSPFPRLSPPQVIIKIFSQVSKRRLGKKQARTVTVHSFSNVVCKFLLQKNFN